MDRFNPHPSPTRANKGTADAAPRRLKRRGQGRRAVPRLGSRTRRRTPSFFPPPSPPPPCRSQGAERRRAHCAAPRGRQLGENKPQPRTPRGPGLPRRRYLSRVGLGLGRLEEGVGQLAQPHGHGLRHIGRLGVHDGVEERLQVGLRVSADVHDLVAGRGCGWGRGGPRRRRGRGRRRGALRGRLGRRLLRGLHGCGLARRSGRCAQARGAASRASIAQHSVPEAAEPSLPSSSSFLPPFLHPGRGGVPTETETSAPDAQTKKLRGAPARAPRGLRLLVALPSSARPPAPNPRPAAPGETFPARRCIPADSRAHVTRRLLRCVRTGRPGAARPRADLPGPPRPPGGEAGWKAVYSPALILVASAF